MSDRTTAALTAVSFVAVLVVVLWALHSSIDSRHRGKRRRPRKFVPVLPKHTERSRTDRTFAEIASTWPEARDIERQVINDLRRPKEEHS